MKKVVPVIVDEMNVMHQLHKINVKGMDWSVFFKLVSCNLNTPTKSYFACANVLDQQSDFYINRKRFFNSLANSGVTLLQGFTVLDFKRKNIEKGVSVLIALQLYKESHSGAKDIILCSADSELIPAVLEAQVNGSRVHLIVSNHTPSKELCAVVDRVISLESIVETLSQQSAVRFMDLNKPYIMSKYDRDFKKSRQGVIFNDKITAMAN